MADEKTYSIIVQTSQSLAALTRLSIAASNFDSTVGKTNAQLRAFDRELSRGKAAIDNANKSLFNAKAEMQRLGKEATVSKNTIASLEGRLNTANKRWGEWKQKAEDARKANATLTKANADLAAQLDRVGAAAQSSSNKVVKGTTETARAVKELNAHFQDNALRYALYDVANSFGVMRDAGVAAYTDLLSTGIAFQRDFANVIRTSQVSNPALFDDPIAATRLLREQFLDLQSTLPVTSEELTRIGTLAAQMGIAADQVAGFTEVTAKFAAASGISADEAATSLARIGQMLAGDVKGDYERLASAILKTGVNAIATEQQIVRGTTQIASIGKVAGLSAQEIIALSSAMSSLGMSPELQRSIVTSSFTKILTAVRGSADEAAKFGAVLGMTGREFQSAWEGDGYNTYRKLLTTISNSPNAIGILQDLGLASQRLTPNLLKLGQAYGLLGQTLSDTNQGWEQDAELQRQYQIIAETTAAQLQKLSQAWDAFIVAIGADAVAGLGGLFDGIRKAVIALRDALQNPLARSIANVILIIGALAVGVLALLTAFTLGGAAILGFRYVLNQLGLTAPIVNTGLAKLGITTVTYTGQTVAATAAARALSVAMKAVAAATLLLAIPDVGRGIADLGDQIKGTDNSVKGLTERVKSYFSQSFGDGTLTFAGVKDLPDWIAAIDRATGPIGGSGMFFKDVAKLDESLSDLANSGKAEEAAAKLKVLRAEFKKNGGSDGAFNQLFIDTYDALKLVSGQTDATSEQLTTYYDGLDSAADAEADATIQAAAFANALGLVGAKTGDAKQAFDDYVAAFKSGASGFFSISDLLDNAYGTDEGQGGGLDRLQADLDDSLTKANIWADGLSQLAIKGAGNLSQAFAAEGPKSQQAVTDALALGPEALARLEQSMADAAFFASDAYAAAFASNNAILADVYKKALEVDPSTALDAVHAFRDALTAGGGILDESTIAQLEGQYGIKFNVSLQPTIDPTALALAQASIQATPLRVPTTMEFGNGTSIEGSVAAYQVELNGHHLIMPVDPNTVEGTKLIQEWRDNEYNTPLSIQTWADLNGIDLQMEQWRIAQESRILSITVRSNLPDLNGTASGSGRMGTFKTGGMIKDGRAFRDNYPKYATGTILRGPGTGTSDSILARVSNGEAITRARAVRYYGTQMMEDINHMRFPRYATGYTPTMGPGTAGGRGGASINVEVTQINPVTRDPLKQLRKASENLVAGLWGDGGD